MERQYSIRTYWWDNATNLQMIALSAVLLLLIIPILVHRRRSPSESHNTAVIALSSLAFALGVCTLFNPAEVDNEAYAATVLDNPQESSGRAGTYIGNIDGSTWSCSIYRNYDQGLRSGISSLIVKNDRINISCEEKS